MARLLPEHLFALVQNVKGIFRTSILIVAVPVMTISIVAAGLMVVPVVVTISIAVPVAASVSVASPVSVLVSVPVMVPVTAIPVTWVIVVEADAGWATETRSGIPIVATILQVPILTTLKKIFSKAGLRALVQLLRHV